MISAQIAAEEFEYEGRTYVLDPFSILFGGDRIGRLRRVLFQNYLQQSQEGRLRAQNAHTTQLDVVWYTLAIDEKTTFLAITTALGNLEDETGLNLIEWLESVEEIHGETRASDGRRLKNDEITVR